MLVPVCDLSHQNTISLDQTKELLISKTTFKYNENKQQLMARMGDSYVHVLYVFYF